MSRITIPELKIIYQDDDHNPLWLVFFRPQDEPEAMDIALVCTDRKETALEAVDNLVQGEAYYSVTLRSLLAEARTFLKASETVDKYFRSD